MPSWAARWIVSRFEQATQIGGCGFCTGLGTTLRSGNREVLALEAGVGVHHHHVGDLLDGLQPHGPSVGRVDSEPRQLGPRGRLARPKSTRPLETRSSVAIRSATRAGVVVAGRHQDDAVAEADALGALAGRRPGTPRAPRSASTPRGSGARPPRRSRCPAGRPARPGRARPGTAAARRRAPTAGAADARRRCRPPRGTPSRRPC